MANFVKEYLEHGKILDNLEDIIIGKSPLDKYNLRQLFLGEGMFAFVSWRWLHPFADWVGDRKVLEVMAGRGWLAHGLRQLNVDVKATDDYSWINEKGWKEPLVDIEDLDAVKSIEVYGSDVDIVIMSWPWMDSTAYRVLRKLHEVNSDAILVYIGEPLGGCTADDSFFDHFEEIEDDWFTNNVSVNLESWDGIYDDVFLGTYKQ
mgnify:CR=1 FL=1